MIRPKHKQSWTKLARVVAHSPISRDESTVQRGRQFLIDNKGKHPNEDH